MGTFFFCWAERDAAKPVTSTTKAARRRWFIAHPFFDRPDSNPELVRLKPDTTGQLVRLKRTLHPEIGPIMPAQEARYESLVCCHLPARNLGRFCSADAAR